MNNTIINSVIKNICVVVLMLGMSASAWGVTITLKVWDHSQGKYFDYGTFEKGSEPGEGPMLYDGVWSYFSVVAWAPGEQNADIAHPNNATSDYYGQYAWPNAKYNGDATTLYAVYYSPTDFSGDYDYYWTTKPNVPLMADCETAPTVTAGSNSSVASTSVTVTCASGISDLGDCSITSYGFAYGTSSNPTTDDNAAQVGTTYGSTGTSFSKSLTGLTASTTYYVRPYATNGAGTSYGAQTSFTTLAQYTISYDNNGGSGTISDQTKDHGVTATLNGGASFSKTGYTLSKWNTASGGGGTDYALSGSYTGNADLELYAIWTPQEYTITLNNQSATTTGSTSITVTYGESTNLTGTPAITVPSKTGYTFGGYYTEDDGDGVQIIADNGNVIAEATDDVEIYTSEDKEWLYAGDITLYAKWTANQYTITLNDNDATTAGSTSVKATYNSSTLPSITNPEKTEKNFAGWYSGEGGTGSLVITTSGQLKENVDGYTGAGGIWTKTSGTTLYAKWVNTIYTVSYNMHGHGVAPSDEEVESGNLATEPEEPVAEDWRFLGWYKESTYDNKWVFSTQTVTADATIHAKWEAVTYNTSTYKAWCEPDITISGDIHLTSVNGVSVYATSTTNNLIRIQSDDLAGVNKLEIKYLDADDGDAEVAKGSSVFRFCNNGTVNFNVADGSLIDVSASNTYDQTYSISYTPTEYNVMHHYKLQITMKRGTRAIKTVTHDLYGRSLPEEFVIATKGNDDIWYALPNTIVDNTSAVTPTRITVNHATTPTAATYAPNTTVFKGDGRYAANSNRYAVRFTDGVVKEEKLNHLQISSSTSTHYPWLSYSGSSTNQDWWLKSTDCSAYELNIPTSGATSAYKLGIYGGNIGYFSSVTSGSIFILPITNKIVDNPASVTEWGKKSVILDVDAQSASSAQARLGDGEPETVASFGQTRSSVKGGSSKYNYTLRFGTTDFSAHKGELLYIDWLDEGDNVLSTSAITIPWIIASDGTMSTIDGTKNNWNTEVHVLPGVTLTADGGSFGSSTVVVKQLEIYQGATVNVTTGTLSVTDLVLRNGWTRAGSKEYDVARLFITPPDPKAEPAVAGANLTTSRVYSDWYIDFDQYYPIAVPWNVTVENMSCKNSSSGTVSIGPGSSDNVRLRYYDGASRATNIQEGVGSGANWKQYGDAGCTAVPTTLTPANGYAMTARRPTGKAFSIIRMPLTIPSSDWTALGEQGEVSSTYKDQVAITAHGVVPESETPYAQGWNFIANPYMAVYQGTITLTPEEGDPTTINVVNIPDVDFREYGQYATATTKLNPSSGFLVQTPATGTITFGTANRKVSAPSYRREVREEARPEQQAYILLSNESAEDMMGIFVSEKYTAGYDLNGDVEKFLSDGTTLRTYMHYGEMKLAYVALTETLAQEWIPVSVRIPATGEYTFSIHEASKVGELEGIYLIDYANGDQITNLIEENYTFVAEAGTIEGRFAINAKVGEHKVPTDIDIVNEGGDLKSEMPFKFIYNDKAYIYYRGVIYDAMGKRVREINK